MTEVELWTVYNHPLDFPDKYVARRFLNDKPTKEIKVGGTLNAVRSQLPRGLTNIGRQSGDDPFIEEVWI